jgi:hypothetical protein
MSRLRKMARIPAASWTQWVVAGVWVRMLVILFPLSAKAKVTAAGTPRCSCSRASRSGPCGQPGLGSAGRLRGDRDQRQSRHHTLVGRQGARQDRRDPEREVST